MSADAVDGSEKPHGSDDSVKEQSKTKEEEGDEEEWESFEEEYTLLAEVDGLDAALMQHDLSYTLVVCALRCFKHALLFVQSSNGVFVCRAQRLISPCCALERSSTRATMLTPLAPTCSLTRTRRAKGQAARDQVFRSVSLDRAPSVSFSSVSRSSHVRHQSPPSDVLHDETCID